MIELITASYFDIISELKQSFPNPTPRRDGQRFFSFRDDEFYYQRTRNPKEKENKVFSPSHQSQISSLNLKGQQILNVKGPFKHG